MAKYLTLTATNFPDDVRPPIWLDDAPQQTNPANQQRLPYTIIEDGGDKPEWTFVNGAAVTGQDGILTGDITITVYYASSATRSGISYGDEAMAAILWNGGVPNSRLGIAFMTMDLATPLRSMAVIPGSGQRKYAGFSYEGKPVYTVSQKFKTKIELVGAGYP